MLLGLIEERRPLNSADNCPGNRHAQDAAVRALIQNQPSLKLTPTVYDHANHPRVIRAVRVDSLA